MNAMDVNLDILDNPTPKLVQPLVQTPTIQIQQQNRASCATIIALSVLVLPLMSALLAIQATIFNHRQQRVPSHARLVPPLTPLLTPAQVIDMIVIAQ